MTNSTQSTHDYNITLFYEEGSGQWEIVVNTDQPDFTDTGNAVGSTPEEALQVLAVEWPIMVGDE
ncbi:hypothetical protein [Gordonia sp. DT101]|uniref:hypothetical protein n=1 Tax=Gordonia sp. DT101 TaxID=3416545 RepID=UPI003CF44088